MKNNKKQQNSYLQLPLHRNQGRITTEEQTAMLVAVLLVLTSLFAGTGAKLCSAD